jgi:hypothetical protein
VQSESGPAQQQAEVRQRRQDGVTLMDADSYNVGKTTSLRPKLEFCVHICA